MAADIRYARSGDVHIAYGVEGDGPIDVVFVPGFVSNVEYLFSDEGRTGGKYLLRRLATFARVIAFDKRGTGLSDRSTGIAPLDVRMDDVRAVMDAAGSERAALVGMSEGGPMSILFAATFPERTQSLLLYGSFASFVVRADHPWMPTLEERAKTRALIDEFWGTGQVLATFMPAEQRTPEAIALLAAGERGSASPGAVDQLMEMNEQIDVRAVLPTIAVPTMVVHATGDETVPVECGRYLAEHIPGARFVPIDRNSHGTLEADAKSEAWLDEYEEFVTGVRPARPVDRVLSTVLFTDIVGSTERAVDVGDAEWKHLLDRHDHVVNHEITRFRGVHVKHTGDGVLARFDGPARAVSCGLAISGAVGNLGIGIRAGVHTGEIELRGDDIGGIGVHIASRVMALAEPNEVLVSRTVRDLVAGSGLSFADRGEHTLKGVPDRWALYAAQN
ncbi:MAG: adenylate/guanylate cyclase domain-containing protein [Actinomycetota bacterium]|nr:adenylate/guanylate cyclase domain-containing protein [Actinomycetota bacterium]